ncbi:MAG: (deoxy)nucleoside triphosphate pyrophosphohydrolase [Acidobacteria bacterium]|nr:(deoxy)nucleoside triphosphate pyrophosphohydrolase [Acidobacteriota bacterium]
MTRSQLVLRSLPRKSAPVPATVRVAAAVIRQSEKILICQRTRHQTMPLKWEFPGGKIEKGEQARHALRRELDEELGIKAVIGDQIARVRHEYGERNRVEIRFFAVHVYTGEIENRIFRDIRWVRPGELSIYDFLEADLEFIKRLADGRGNALQR